MVRVQKAKRVSLSSPLGLSLFLSKVSCFKADDDVASYIRLSYYIYVFFHLERLKSPGATHERSMAGLGAGTGTLLKHYSHKQRALL